MFSKIWQSWKSIARKIGNFQAVETALQPFSPTRCRALIISDTSRLELMLASQALLPEARQRKDLQMLGIPQHLSFDPYGNLLSRLSLSQGS